MAKLTLADLKKLREEKKTDAEQRETIQVVIGLGTCGVAAGAKETYDAFVTETESRGLKNVTIKQTGCIGLCYAEPTVEVIVSGMPRVIYGNVRKEIVKKIVKEHLVNRSLVSDYIFDKPATDILR